MQIFSQSNLFLYFVCGIFSHIVSLNLFVTNLLIFSSDVFLLLLRFIPPPPQRVCTDILPVVLQILFVFYI